MKKYLFGTILLTATIHPLMAQTPIPRTPTAVATGCYTADASNNQEAWAKMYFAGDWVKLQKSIIETLGSVTMSDIAKPTDTVPLDFDNNYYTIAFVTKARKADGEILRVLVHDKKEGVAKDAQSTASYRFLQPFGTTLPGVPKIFEVFVSSNQQVVFSSFYTITPVPNPLAKDLVKAAGQLKLGDVIGGLQHLAATPSPSPCDTLVTLGAVDLSHYARASIDVESHVVGPPGTDKKPNVIDGKATYLNTPPMPYSVSSIAAGMFSPQHERRYKLSGGKLASDPLHGALGIIALNRHFAPVSADANFPTQGERFRVFGGLTVTPEFGLAGGAGYLVIPGLSVNVGHAWLRVSELRAGETANAAPVHANPFRNGVEGVWFVGLGYNF